MKILIIQIDSTGSGAFVSESKDLPKAGSYYFLDDATTGTSAQNRLFHALLGEYQKAGTHPTVGGDDFATLKNWVKKKLGAGFESFVYIDPDEAHPTIHDAAKYSAIPERIRKLPWKADIIRGRLKSWADYTMTERKATIDRLILDMLSNGVSSKKFDQILEEIGYDGQ